MDMARFDILGLGCMAVDDLLYVERYPSADCKTRVLRRQRQGGGLTGTGLDRRRADGRFVPLRGPPRQRRTFANSFAAGWSKRASGWSTCDATKASGLFIP